MYEADKIEENENIAEINHLISKKEEMKIFLREYESFENGVHEFFYILPFSWIKSWDSYITDPLY